jgi:hypothetical protein
VTPATAEALAGAVGRTVVPKPGREGLSHREHQVFRLLISRGIA